MLIMRLAQCAAHNAPLTTFSCVLSIAGLDISNYVKGSQHKMPKTLVYDLSGVSNHIGGTGGGHYTAYCHNFRNEVMYSLNDAM
jgi:hypothetical protein